MEEPNGEKIDVMLRLRQVLEDFQGVRRELRAVLGIMAAWDESGVATAPDLVWPHGDSLKHGIRQWLRETGRPGEDQPELSRTFVINGEEVRVWARHVLDHFWLVSTRRAAPNQEGSAGDDGGELTAVAVVPVSPEAESQLTGNQDLGGDGGEHLEFPTGGWPRYRQERDEYGELESIGIPPEAHGIEDLEELDEDPEARARVAGILLEKGAPPAACVNPYGWEIVEFDEEGWLWISYRPRHPGRRP